MILVVYPDVQWVMLSQDDTSHVTKEAHAEKGEWVILLFFFVVKDKTPHGVQRKCPILPLTTTPNLLRNFVLSLNRMKPSLGTHVSLLDTPYHPVSYFFPNPHV